MIQVDVNGTPLQIPQGSTLDQLLLTLELSQKRLAIELNLDVIPRSQYSSQQLQQGDQIEVVHAIGGG